MPELNLPSLPATGPLLGLDPGAKSIGVAASDGLRMIATPVEIITRGKKLRPVLNRLFEIYDERACVGLVVGLPLNLDGSSGPRVQAARALVYNLLQFRDVPLAFQDERLSSAEAERVMLAADMTRARRAATIDASAAAIILQTALDRLANSVD
ncbi:MAG: Holliday junction resolvase RuvX [Hyphomonadaceae bacterium]|nr:Holliday junction resolvase RuvX [Hyphomonadaceae bacterium]